MFYLGVVDFCATIVGGTIGGILLIRGDIFCTNKDLVFVSSALACRKFFPCDISDFESPV